MSSLFNSIHQPAQEHGNADSQSATRAQFTIQFPDIRTETRPTVNTATTAYWLSRRPQTLRGWACHEDGPLRPIRVNGRLAWAVADIKRLLGV